MPKPDPSSYPAYFKKYTDQVPEEDLFTSLDNQLPMIREFLSSIPEEKSSFAYGEGKWTLKELLQHIIDTERIFCYRALCFARKEKASLPGFDENDYASHSHANERKWKELVNEFLVVREGTTTLFNSFSATALNNSGISDNKPITTLAAGFIILGHFYHHKKIMEERYL